jgi:hypothetical protein
VLEVQQKREATQIKAMVDMAKIQQQADEATDREDIEILRLASSIASHPEANIIAMDAARNAKGLVRD